MFEKGSFNACDCNKLAKVAVTSLFTLFGNIERDGLDILRRGRSVRLLLNELHSI